MLDIFRHVSTKETIYFRSYQSSHSSRLKTFICKPLPCGWFCIRKLFSVSRSQPTDESKESRGTYIHTAYIHVHIHTRICIHTRMYIYIYTNTYGLPPLRSAGKLPNITLLSSWIAQEVSISITAKSTWKVSNSHQDYAFEFVSV